MQSQEDKPMIFCNNISLPPTTVRHWRVDSTNITHYDGCCPVYNQIIEKEREEHIKSYMYLSKINNWVCPHTCAKYTEEQVKSIPLPPQRLHQSWPNCCINDLDLTLSRTHKKVKDKVFNIEDALNDPDIAEQYKLYLSNNN